MLELSVHQAAHALRYKQLDGYTTLDQGNHQHEFHMQSHDIPQLLNSANLCITNTQNSSSNEQNMNIEINYNFF